MNKDEVCDWLTPYRDIKVVIDLDTGHILIGTLLDFSREHLLFDDTDLHDSKKANSTKEVYLSEAYRYGINVNRKQVAIPRSRVLAVAKLEDTII